MTPQEELELLDIYEAEQSPRSQIYGPEQTSVPRQPEGLSGKDAGMAALHGVGQGATFGGSDEMAGLYGAATGGSYEESRDEYRKTLDEYKQKAPVISAMGDVAGSLVSGYGAFKALGSPSTLLGSTAFGATEGALNAAGRSSDVDDFVGQSLTSVPIGAVAGAGGYGVVELYNRIRRGQKYIPGKRQQQADALNIELTPAQKYGDQSLHRVEAAMQADPGYGKPFDELAARNQDQVNRIANKTIGIDSNTLTEVEMGDAARKISAMFDRATAAGVELKFDGKWVDDFDGLMSEYKKIWGKKDATVPLMDDVWATTTEKGFITPKEYQSYYSQLGKDLEKARLAGDGHEMDLLHGLRRSLDDLLDRSAPGKSTEFKRARDLYRNKLILQQPGVTRTETGNVSPLILGNRLRNDKRGYLEGENQSDLYNMARVAQGTKSGIGDSGTATRSKTMGDYATAPIKERAGQLYLSGKAGTNIMGGSTGKGGAANPFLNSLMLAPDTIETVLEEERRRNQ